MSEVDGDDEDGTRAVEIPGTDAHRGMASVVVRVRWVCPGCGRPRGQVFRTTSRDGDRRLPCDGWRNPCGHVDHYADVRIEAADNGLNRAATVFDQGLWERRWATTGDRPVPPIP